MLNTKLLNKDSIIFPKYGTLNRIKEKTAIITLTEKNSDKKYILENIPVVQEYFVNTTSTLIVFSIKDSSPSKSVVELFFYSNTEYTADIQCLSDRFINIKSVEAIDIVTTESDILLMILVPNSKLS